MKKEIIEAYASLKACKGGAEEMLEKIMIEELGIKPDLFSNIHNDIAEDINNNYKYCDTVEFSKLLYYKYKEKLSAEVLD